MFWADKLLENRKGKEWVNDAWTPSGITHMGGLKGPVIHDTLYKILKDQGEEVASSFGFDDYDPIDGLPENLKEKLGKYMGIPTCSVPAPEGEGTFAQYYGNVMRDLFKSLNIEAKIYLASENYRNGTYNKAIKIVLDNVEELRKIYSEMYKKPIANDWYPLQVVCPNCGKIGTTKVTGWDGKEVSFECSNTLVKWAEGCGATGKISPFNGNAKMPWKPEWAAKWWTFGVTIEGSGKDHSSAGGSHDLAIEIAKRVFKITAPLRFAYEFFLYDGKKMSSSKGLGLTAKELLEVVPPEIVRFLMIKNEPNTAVEFNPFGTQIIPKLYDDYQKAAEEFKNKEGSDMARAFQLSAIKKITFPPKIRFSVLAQWVQMPNMEEKIKKEGLEEWAKYARIWVDRFAPDLEKFAVQKELPETAKHLSDVQKKFIKKVSEELNKKWIAEDFQKNLFEWAKEIGISSKDAFAAIYTSLIGKDHGPKAGWLILSLDKEFVKKRFNDVNSHSGERSDSRIDSGQAVRRPELTAEWARMTINNIAGIFSIDQKVKETFPSISVGVAIIKNVHIEKSNSDLEKEKLEILKSLENLTTEQLGQYPEVISYRKLYKEMKVDWHSKRPSPEALLRRIALKKGLYTVNTCVDAYNLVVIKHRVSVGAFDLDNLSMPSVLRFPNKNDKILLLGDETETEYKETELGYFDKNGGYNIDFNYRDAKRTAVQTETKNLYINVDGIYDITPDKVEQVLKDACDTIIKYCGGKLELLGIEVVL